MNYRKILMMILAIAAIMLQMAMAESRLSAQIEDGILRINWNAEGSCILTVYRNNWPVSVSRVEGYSGGAEIRVEQTGKYSVRLNTPAWCERIDVIPEDNIRPELTAAPTRVPATAEPTESPTVVPTKNPATAAPTVVPTKRPAPTPAVSAPAQDGQSMTSMAAQVVSMVNEERAKYGLEPLSVDAQLTAAACVRAKEIVQNFSHTRPDGTSWSTVSSLAKGENIAKGQSSAERVMSAWMTSEGHRANILRESFGSIGVCALQVNGVIHWVQLFSK